MHRHHSSCRTLKASMSHRALRWFVLVRASCWFVTCVHACMVGAMVNAHITITRHKQAHYNPGTGSSHHNIVQVADVSYNTSSRSYHTLSTFTCHNCSLSQTRTKSSIPDAATVHSLSITHKHARDGLLR